MFTCSKLSSGHPSQHRPSHSNIHPIHNRHLWESWGRGRGVPRVRMGSKGERECSPVDEEGRDECAMSAPRNQDSMVPPSNATPRRGGPEGGGVPVLTDSPDTSVSG